ncbi:SIR2 family protein [bacterium]|nr:SIR2 family protein [bacterium]
MKKKIVILTGAGFTKLWDAPTTKDITDSVCNLKEPLVDKVYELLKKQKEINSINFEHIINEIEEIHQYFCRKSKLELQSHGGFSHAKTDWSISDSTRDEIFTFPLNDEIKRFCEDKYYPLQKGLNISNLPPSDDIQRNIRDVYENIIDRIFGRVIEYVDRSKLSCKDSMNKLMSFLSFFFDYTIRSYTLNYDHIVNSILDGFDGFDQKIDAEYYAANPQRIFRCLDENCNFNLHGSIYYESRPNNNWFEWVRGVNYSIQSEPDKYDQKGNPILMTPIITGLNKANRILFKPMSYFFHAFQTDCLQANIIMTLGYSFSDVHINQAIQAALDIGNCKFVSVDCAGWDKNIDDIYSDEQWKKLTDLNIPSNKEYCVAYPPKTNNNGLFYRDRRYLYLKGIDKFVEDEDAWELIKK